MSFWLENPLVLVESGEIFPSSDDTLEERLNTLTRLCLVVWGVMALSGYRWHSHFLMGALLFLIIIYYAKVNIMRENYTPLPVPPVRQQSLPLAAWQYLPTPTNLDIQNPTRFRFCNDQRPIQPNKDYYSTNMALASQIPSAPVNNASTYRAGQVYAAAQAPQVGNPKTHISPAVVAPIFANDYWSEDFIIPSKINDMSNTELYNSGYLGSSRCGQTYGMKMKDVPTEYQPKPYPNMALQPQVLTAVTKPGGNGNSGGLGIQEDFGLPTPLAGAPIPRQRASPAPPRPGDVLGCNYNPANLKHNLPSNQSVGTCQTIDAYDSYNKNLYTQIIEPGIYARSEIIEPVQANMGITWTQQFEPVVCEKDEQGGRTFVSQDPRMAMPIQPVEHPPQATNSNVYDPRYFGYGTSYRSYVDPMTGQPRFYYDDVDAIRRPNYIVRSNIDDAPWADAYGPMTSTTTESREFNHAMANNKFLNDSLQQRAELEQRYMRKYNAEIGWQRRQAPIFQSSIGMKGFA